MGLSSFFQKLAADAECGHAALLPEDGCYGDFSGAPHFREQLAALLTTHMRPSRGRCARTTSW